MPMTMQCILGWITVASYTFINVLAEVCEDGTRCAADQHCCTVGCCYGPDYEEERRYTYGYRLSIWNMWYFWFVVLFLMMSCFGGCGYYKQRQRVLRGQNPRGLVSILGVSAPTYRRNRTPVDMTVYPRVGAGSYPIYHASGPPADGSNFEPPPYTEVMNNPGMFPANTKTTPTGPDAYATVPEYSVNHSNQEPTNQMPQPPPYSEVANQEPESSAAANHNSGSQQQAANQNTAQ